MAKYRKLVKGEKIGDLEFLGSVPGRRSEWLCSCGKTFTCLTGDVKSGRTRSCGCLRAQAASERMKRRHAEGQN